MGLDWRSWSAADRAAIAYLMLKRLHRDDPTELRSLYEMVGDRDALAELAREIMGQPKTLTTDF